MHPQAFKAAILDMDGVITHTEDLHAKAWKQMFDEYLQQREAKHGEIAEAFDLERDYRRHVDGKPRYDGVNSFLQSRGIQLPWGTETDAPEQETVCGLGNRKNAIFQQLLETGGVQVYEDTVEQIHNWKNAGMKVAVISSSRNCKAVLKAAKLRELFDAKVDGNDLNRYNLQGKPAPDVFLHAAKQLGIQPEEAVAVEDAISGVQACRAGKFRFVVGVARNRDASELLEAGADYVVEDLRELQTLSYCPPGENCLAKPCSAIEHADWIAQRVQGKQLGLFLDYDGTLTPIVRRPEDATLSDQMRQLLSDLAPLCQLAIVSGRDRQDVESMVQLDSLIYAGSHGFDIHGPGDMDMQQEDAVKALSDLDAAEAILREPIGRFAGARLERKKYAIAIHYREVESEELVAEIEHTIDEVVAEHPQLRKRGGKKIFELQPDVQWDKGQAILWLIKALRLDPAETVVLYIGDDVTDEDAFRVLRARGFGMGLRVEAPTSETQAIYYLRDCDEVYHFLQSLHQILVNK